MSATLRIEAENRLDEIDRVNEAFEAFSAGHGLPPRVRRALKLVFDDVIHNIIAYAYDDGERHTIEVTVEVGADRVSVRISDDGHPFNPASQTPPDVALTLEDREVGGLGIHLMGSLMDEVTYTRQADRNMIELVKYLPAKAEAGNENP